LDNLLSKYDALIAPTMPTIAYPVGVQFSKAYPEYEGGPAMIPACNAVGIPAISIPNGFGKGNLPTGIQFIGRARNEATLIQIADSYQQATDWHRRRPPV
jgi:aspartyl-tRNA(Asn)/glutamyl-tRNA(Gln) amidotransferase subunit A